MSIYLDNAAATPVAKEVKAEIIRALVMSGNPSSFNDEGRKARKELESARLKVARFLGTYKEEIIFTSSGTEANNLAIKGAVALAGDKREIITTPIEHPSVLEPIKNMARRGFKVVYLRVDEKGLVDPEELKKKITSKTVLVSIMYANNEIGTIEPVTKIGKIIEEFNKKLEIENWKLKIDGTRPVLFHVDACQAAGYLDVNVNRLGVDLLTFNGTKIYGPRGVGVLYVRRGTKLNPEILGGDQELGLRAGTENLPSIIGLAKALLLIKKNERVRVVKLRDYFIDQLKTKLPEAILNGSIGNLRLPNNINMSLPDTNSENILLELDKYKIYAGSGSACTARSVEPSHVLKAIGSEAKYLNGTIRFSLGRQTTKKDIDYVLKVLPKIVTDLKKRYKK